MRVSLVIPARDAADTLRPCLRAVLPLCREGALGEVLVVDDGSRDATATVAREEGAACLPGPGAGPGAARNLGWRAAGGDLVWFLDADCVAGAGALDFLLEHLRDPPVAAAGGTYANLRPDSLLASLIQEEIAVRHARMPREVDYLATFNVLYRRRALESVGGFDESLRTAEDVDLAYRVRRAGGVLRFERRSRVGHFHPARLFPYLRTQLRHGYWRARLYRKHPAAALTGDAYSGWLDHLQPPLALLSLPALACLWTPWPWLTPAPLLLAAVAALPMAWRLQRRTGGVASGLYLGLSVLRAFPRGAGLALGILRRPRPAPG